MDSSKLTPEQLNAYLNQPLAPPPLGIKPDYDNPPHPHYLDIPLLGFFLALGSLGFFARAYSKVSCGSQPRIEDYLCVLAFGSYIGTIATLITLAQGLGFWVHTWNVKVKDLQFFIEKTLLSISFYCLTMLFAKTAILLEWIRVFVPKRQRNSFFWICSSIIGANFIVCISAIIATQLSCIPREKHWIRFVPGTCIDRKPLDTSIIIFNLLFDLIILFLPQKVIWKLNLTRKRKIGVSIIFSVGVLACIAGTGRVYAVVTLNYNGDATYGSSAVFLWASAEATFVLLAFCIPGVPKAFTGAKESIYKLAGSFKSWSKSTLTLSKDDMRLGNEQTWQGSPNEGSHSTVCNHTDERSEIPLTNLEFSSTKSLTDVPDQGRILRTTEFWLEESTGQQDTQDDPSVRQHPWMRHDE